MVKIDGENATNLFLPLPNMLLLLTPLISILDITS